MHTPHFTARLLYQILSQSSKPWLLDRKNFQTKYQIQIFFGVRNLSPCSILEIQASLWTTIPGNALVLSKDLFHRYAEQTFELQV